ncbi:unnamed protein product, partial [Prorocentrum cordatum]
KPKGPACEVCFLKQKDGFAFLTFAEFVKLEKTPEDKRAMEQVAALQSGGSATWAPAGATDVHSIEIKISRKAVVMNSTEYTKIIGAARGVRHPALPEMTIPREDGDGDETVYVFKHPYSPIVRLSSASHLDRASNVFEDQARMVVQQLVDKRNKQVGMTMLLHPTAPLRTPQYVRDKVQRAGTFGRRSGEPKAGDACEEDASDASDPIETDNEPECEGGKRQRTGTASGALSPAVAATPRFPHPTAPMVTTPKAKAFAEPPRMSPAHMSAAASAVSSARLPEPSPTRSAVARSSVGGSFDGGGCGSDIGDSVSQLADGDDEDEDGDAGGDWDSNETLYARWKRKLSLKAVVNGQKLQRQVRFAEKALVKMSPSDSARMSAHLSQ